VNHLSQQPPNDGTAAEAVPLVVDVDGTLIRTDLLHEAALQFVAHHPLEAWRLIAWIVEGKARLKTALAGRVASFCGSVPLREEVVAAIREAQAVGRPVYLASASERRYVEAIAQRVGGIAGIFATEATTNLSGPAKARRLNESFGERGYDYVGNCKVDFAIWQSARHVLVVSPSRSFSSRVSRAFPEAKLVAEHRREWRHYLPALRMHQWAKNLLVFLPLIAGHALDAQSIGRTVLAFLCFCMAASSAYIINDLMDLPGDRDHARKRNRPFASGTIPVAHGPPVAVLLLALAFGTALLLPAWFMGVLALYVTGTLAYSLVLKRKVLIDVITLGALYTLRVLGGVAAVGVEQSPWLLMFSLFLFLSLAIVKRCSELVARRARGKEAAVGRGYRVEDLNVMLGLGAAAGYGAVLVVSLYITSPAVQELYGQPQWLWLICPLLLYWTSRMLILANRDLLHDDPVVFALTDRVTWLVGSIAALVIAVAI
jgi:4-hydroxybenzoate polyprenyltransferase/phosphoserine phosphatase